MSIRRAHYVLSTHWDREWYQTFQDFRYRLVGLLDRVLAGLEDGRLQGPFQTDGQAIMLDDYLEVRPERRPQVEAMVQDGRLAVGPWYVLPDEFLVSGESLVRNLRLGREVVRAYGGTPSDAGFVCDIFGHNSQMPQILQGFGIRGGFIWRGTNTVGDRNVLWRGADGSEIPCYRFGDTGYCTYAAGVRGARFHTEAADLAVTRARLAQYLEREAATSEVDPLLLFDGCDHQEWDEAAYAAIAERLGAAGEDGIEIVHSTLDAYLEEMLPQRDRIETVLEGELREPARFPATEDNQWLIPGVLSSRVWIKQWNARCQTLLCHWAEPFAALAEGVGGLTGSQGFLDVAWRWLLKNHPHDSICGCSIDQVHEDMRFRFSQCEGIAERLTVEATRALAAAVEGEIGEDALRICVFNPLPTPHEGTAEITVQVPTDWPTFNEFFGFEPKPAFRIYDAAGDEVPYQRLAQAMGRVKTRIRPTRFPESFRTHDVTVSLPLTVPAMGYTTLTVRTGETRRVGRVDVALPTRHPSRHGLATSERSMANEYVGVTVEPNGTLTIDDLRTGHTYRRLLTFEDIADIGDGWYHGMAVNDQCFVSTGAASEVALVHDGPYLTTFRVRTTLRVPEAF
ncbi:MAG: glycoside hydrolase family 38, partial [Chloroflexi bacterium]|nr:glycoside hydrolase family 38 [Chloroflexota bacterium]